MDSRPLRRTSPKAGSDKHPRCKIADGSGHVQAMHTFDTPLPIDAILPALAKALAARPNAALVAPPDAGKTTRVPFALLDEPQTPDPLIL